MRVLIISDMEGVSGIVVWEQVIGGQPLFEEGRRLYTEEINAAVRGARSAGATEVVVVDCHGAGEGWDFNSLEPNLIDPGCEWVSHHPWARYTEFLERGCDACVLVGMHARAGTPNGVLCHTISTTSWRNLWFGDTLVGEIGIHAALCGHFGCPVVVVTGDHAACAEARALLGENLHTVAVKRGLSRYSARHIPPLRAREMIEQGVKAALTATERPAPYVPARPCSILVEVGTVDNLRRFRGRPGVEIIEPLSAVTRGEIWMDAWDRIWDQ
jgi:D-amino peptidase